jgi:hypothetical protein
MATMAPRTYPPYLREKARQLRRERKPPTYWVQYHADQDLDELRTFWASQLGADPESIRLQRKSNSNQLKKRTWRSAYGVLTVRVSDTYLRAKLEAWMDCLRKEWLNSKTTIGV